LIIMKIAITSTAPDLDAKIDPRLGRAQYFIILDPETMEFESIENPNINLGGGAGIQSAQLLSEKGVSAILTGNCGPNAFQVFDAAGIQVIVGVTGNVRQAVDNFNAGTFSAAPQANVADHSGLQGETSAPAPPPQQPNNFTAPGMGRGRGKGMGRGHGMGGGMGRRMAYQTNPQFPIDQMNPQIPKNDELKILKEQAGQLQEQLQAIQNRISELEKV